MPKLLQITPFGLTMPEYETTMHVVWEVHLNEITDFQFYFFINTECMNAVNSVL